MTELSIRKLQSMTLPEIAKEAYFAGNAVERFLGMKLAEALAETVMTWKENHKEEEVA